MASDVLRNQPRSTALGYALLAPSLFGVLAFLLLPILVVIWLSLYRWDLLGPLRYVGLANWRSVLADSNFGNSLVVTAVFVAIVVPAQTMLGLLAASMLARQLPGTGLFRTLYVLPWICAPLAIAVLWRWILAPTDGAVSTVWDIARMAVGSQLCAAARFGRRRLDQRRICLAVVPGGPAGYPRRHSRRRAHRWRQCVAAILAHHPAHAAADDVLCAGHRDRQHGTGFRYRLCADGRRTGGSTELVAHRIYAEAFGSAAIGRASVMAVVLFVILIGVTMVQHLYFRRRISYDLT